MATKKTAKWASQEATMNLVRNVVKQGVKYHTMLHTAAIQSLYWAAHESGYTAPLNTLFDSLTTNYQSALKGSYVPRIHAALGGLDFSKYIDEEGKPVPVPPEVMQAAQETGSWLGYSNKSGFYVEQGRMDVRKKFIKTGGLLETIANPDGVVWRPFYDRNVLAEQQVLGNKEFVSKITDLIKKAGSGKDGKVRSEVDPKLLAIAKKAEENMVHYLEVNTVQ